MLKVLKNFFHFIIPQLADIFYGFPGKRMIIIGVTGTKGKSSTCRFIASVLEAGGHKVGLLTTVEFQIAGERVKNDRKMTMLGRGEIQKMMKKMVKAGCRYVVIETSSEGILQYRHLGVHYDIGVFTNLGTEHSERHGGFENLKRDKGKLFAILKTEPNKIIDGKKVKKAIIANADDENAGYFLNFPADRKYAFGMENQEVRIINYELKTADKVIGKILKSNEKGSSFSIHDSLFPIHLPGKFNVYNALAAVAVGKSQNIPDEKIARGIESVKGIAGRMEFIEAGQNFKVVVDYAHEPLSLTELFDTLNSFKPAGKKLIAIVGSDGGGRDKEKREKMGEIAGRLADIVIITDVNCFDEDPKVIAEMLAKGARQAGKKDGVDLLVEVDRKKAIEKAFGLAGEGDAVAITAKGTEPCIVVTGGKKIPWDDREAARKIIKGIS